MKINKVVRSKSMHSCIRVLSSKISNEYLIKGEILLEKSHSYRSKPKYRRALQYFYQALQFAPSKTANLYAKISETYFFLDKNMMSVNLANKALSIDKNCLLAYEMLHINSYEDEEIIEYCQQIIRLKPSSGFAYFDWGRTLKRLGRLKEAKNVLYQGLEKDPGLALVRTLATLEYQLGNRETANKIFSDYAAQYRVGFRKTYVEKALAHFYLETGQI